MHGLAYRSKGEEKEKKGTACHIWNIEPTSDISKGFCEWPAIAHRVNSRVSLLNKRMLARLCGFFFSSNIKI